MDYSAFRKETLKLDKKGKVGKVNNSWGIYDAYKWIRKNKWYDIGRPLKEHEFYSIVRGINKLMGDEVTMGKSVDFPYKLGHLELRKTTAGVSFKDGKLRITYPIDWDSTLRLWFEDTEAREKKTLVRFESKDLFHVRYCKYKARYKNMSYYQFNLNRSVRRRLKDNIKLGKVDAIY